MPARALSAHAPRVRPGAEPSSRVTRVWRAFALVVAGLFAGYLARTIAAEPRNWLACTLIGGLFACSAFALAWLARLAWLRIRAPGTRWLVTSLLAWHALFGVVMLAQRIRTDVSSNDDLAPTLWPHIVRAINALE